MCLHTDPYAAPGSGDVGGMNVVVRHTAEALAARGHDVTVATRLSDPAAPIQENPGPGVTVRRLPAGPERHLPKGEHELVIEAFAERLAELEPPDLVHAHHWFSGAAAMPVARTWQIPHVQSFHSIAADPATALAEGERPESPGRLAGEARLAQLSDGIVAVSHAEAATVTGRLGADPERVHIAWPGVDAAFFTPAQSPRDRAGHLLVAARLEPLKGIDLAIEALAAMPPADRPRLVIAGGPTEADGSYERGLSDLADRLGVTDEVEFAGARSRLELADLMRGAVALLVTSHSETYGLVALEAAASGVPVIAAASGGLREAVVDGVTGVLLIGRDPALWAQQIERVLADETLARQFGDAGRSHALHRTWAHTARLTESAYRAVLATDRGAIPAVELRCR